MFSIVATETSVLTFISIPGIAYRGNWVFLQLAFGYILGRVLVSFLFLPKYFESGITSIYEILGNRFGTDIQKVASGVFLVTRLLADGIRFLATAVIVQVVTGWTLPVAVLVIGIITLVYSLLGGIRTIVWIDSFQFFIYLAGGIITIFYILSHSTDSAGDILFSLSEIGKTQILNFSGDFMMDPYYFISAVIGGTFLSLSSHGVDYMMVQRVLGTKDLRSGQKAMIGSGIFVMLQFGIFLLAGSLIFHYFDGVALQKDREFSSFIVDHLPIGLRGLLLAGILSAAMSTLSSSINSLASSTIVDWFGGKSSLRTSRFVSFFWATVLIGIALIFDESDSAIVIIGLQIASFTYGGLLGLFILSKLNRKFSSLSLIVGLVSSCLIVFYLKHIGLAWTWFILASVMVNITMAYISEAFLKPTVTKISAVLVFLISVSVFYSSFFMPNHPKEEYPDSKLIASILDNLDDRYDPVIKNPEKFRCQIIYTMIERDDQNNPTLETHSYALKPDTYFYPASAIKFPIAALALEKLNQIEAIDRDTPLIIFTEENALNGVSSDTTSVNGKPSVGHYIHKLFVVSNNDSFNRLYEFLGRDHINQRLWDLGYSSARIRHRLSIDLSKEKNRYTNPFKFYDGKKIVYNQPSQLAKLDLDVPYNMYLLGKSYIKENEIIKKPLDFSEKNFMNLMDQHRFLIQLIFPENVDSNQGLNLTKSDYDFLLEKMSILPRESQFPEYDTDHYYDSYCKFFLFGDKKERISNDIRIFNKVGLAYGFLLDNAYVVDFNNKVEFFLSAVIYGNENGILNDNTYEYDTFTIPFLADLGRVIYDYELQRKRENEPDLNRFRFNY